jgi:hypothetical protein
MCMLFEDHIFTQVVVTTSSTVGSFDEVGNIDENTRSEHGET